MQIRSLTKPSIKNHVENGENVHCRRTLLHISSLVKPFIQLQVENGKNVFFDGLMNTFSQTIIAAFSSSSSAKVSTVVVYSKGKEKFNI